MVSLFAAFTSGDLRVLGAIRARLRPAVLLLPAIAAAAPGSVVGAQGTVSGQVSIVERPGARTTDLADAVVWLEPRGGGANPSHSRAQIVMESREFVPRVRVVSTGSAVGFPNQEPLCRFPGLQNHHEVGMVILEPRNP